MNKLAGGEIAYNSDPFRNFFPSKPPSVFMNLINSTDHHQHEKRAVVDEMDFFSSDKNRVREYDQNKGAAKDMMIKKEDSHGGSSSRFSNDVNTGLNLLTANTLSDQSTVDDDGISPNADDKRSKNELEDLQQDLVRMNSENQKLKGMLNQVTSNYNTLQMQLVVLMQQKSPKIETSQDHEMVNVPKHEENRVNEMIPRQFMDLGLATTNTEVDELSHSSSEGKSHDRSRTLTNTNVEESSLQKKEMVLFDHQEKSELGSSRDDEESLEDHPSQGWVPNKIPKLNSPLKNVESQQQQPMEATMRKPRVSVRARSEAPMITDGCQWRKYGQKMAKGNPCPRAYYRCTMAAACPVRKQVQRCAEDRTILITTYEGTHNHPLPPAAMAMASTTSTAATMLLSGSMSSADGLMNSNFLTRTLLPCSSSMATISASAPFPTVTLDLTQSPNNPLQFQRPTTQFHVPFMNQPPSQGFGSRPAAQPPLPHLFGQSPYNQSKFSGLQMSSQNGDQAHHINNHQSPPRQQQQAQPNSLADTVSAATAAITADPNFTAALAAAISSIMSGGGQQTMNNNSSSCNTASNTNNSTD
ncbi:hypothetical protein MKX01_022297 [Papaver californicum]|nr:hypothetical protein MKX01_022297 [Papaver californicum]